MHLEPLAVSLSASDKVQSTDDGTDRNSWLVSAPALHTERRIQRTESFQRHGYAVLVTSAMLKLAATVHEEFENGSSQMPADKVDDKSKHDQEDDAKSSSSSSSSSSGQLSGQYYYGMNNVDSTEINLARSVRAAAGNRHFVKGVESIEDSAKDDEHSSPSTSSTDDEQPPTNGMRL